MHLLLTDRLSCPRCGPDFGLILLAHEVRNRRILSGDFGCANCRETYPVEDGFGDLRAPPRAPLAELLEEKGVSGPHPQAGSPSAREDEEALRLAALMGVTAGPGTLLLEGPAAYHARAIAVRVGGVEVVALNPALRWDPEEEGVSRMLAGPGLPFFSGSLRAVLLSGRAEERILEESVRVLMPGGRVVLLDAPSGTGRRLEGTGIRIVLDQEGVLVGERKGAGSRPLVTLRGS